MATNVNMKRRADQLPMLPNNFFWTYRKRPADIKLFNEIRERYDLTPGGTILTTKGYKIETGEGMPIVYLGLAPSDMSGFNVCKNATKYCKPPVCVGISSGFGQFPTQQKNKIARTVLLFENFPAFMRMLLSELAQFRAKVLRDNPGNPVFAVRLNAYSDLNWSPVMDLIRQATGHERESVFREESHAVFYDFTKIKDRVAGHRSDCGEGDCVINESESCLSCASLETYYAYSGRSVRLDPIDSLIPILKRGHNVAIVVDQLPLGDTWHGFPFVDGTENDRYVFSRRGHWILLSARGELKNRKDSPFIYRVAN
jgi:hypothetical protein